ncbi:MAG: tetraacyldisaccharide 4'-kinase [Nonlabens sp.]
MQQLRLLLFPIAIIYDLVTRLRNWLFDNGIKHRQAFNIPVIAVGNLSTGGTGKTPMVEYLVTMQLDKKVAVLSRGYGRKTSGYREVTMNSTAAQVGDEPLQIKRKFGDAIMVAVCEKRVDGIRQLIADYPSDIMLLDDAYQHRYVKASYYILLTSYDRPFYSDYVLPAGNLREARKGYQRAQSIVVTKCPPDLSNVDQQFIIKRIDPLPGQQIYFSYIKYGKKLLSINGVRELNDLSGKEVTIITGIAKPQPFIDHLNKWLIVDHLQYSDHHHFTTSEIELFKSKDILITTEKDFMRLIDHQIPQLFYLPMEIAFIGDALDLKCLKSPTESSGKC